MTDILERLREERYRLVSLLSAVEREIERLRAELENDEFDADLCAENDNMRVEIERLRAELATCRELRRLDYALIAKLREPICQQDSKT
jgi:uncharacterized small protein (DUF1192 family)